MPGIRSLAVAIALLLTPATTVAGPSPETVGVWRDKVNAEWDQTIRIQKLGGLFTLECSFPDGSTVHRSMVAVKCRRGERQRFRDRESEFGEEYVIMADGDLALYDREGFIRKAKRK